MTYHLTPEQMALLGLSNICWSKRGAAKRFGLDFGEESVTETVLLELAATFPGMVSIVPFSKPREGRLGADWAWAFMSADGKHVYPMLVQAKALDLSDKVYPEIKRNVGKIVPPVRQIDRLLATADSFGWPAIYAFYNHLNDETRIPSECGSLAMSGIPRFAPAWGISVADAEQVRAVLDDQTFDTHRLHSMPLHCLLCSGGSGIRPIGGSAELALAGVKRLRALARKQAPDRASTDMRPVLDETLSALPEMFMYASFTSKLLGGWNARDSEEMAERHPGIAGVVLLRDAKEKGSGSFIR